jgi:hypothetical protein
MATFRQKYKLKASLPAVSPDRQLNLFLIFYISFCIEAIMRRWALPDASQYLYFFSPVVFSCILILFFLKQPHKAQWTFFSIVGLAVLTVIQAIWSDHFVFDLRIITPAFFCYCIYPTMLVYFASVDIEEFLRRLVKINFWFLLANAAIMIVQFFSSPDAPINTQIGANDYFQSVGAAFEHVRPTGIFNSAGTNGKFLYLALCSLISYKLVVKRYNPVHFAIQACIIAFSFSISINRSAMLFSAIFITLASPVIARDKLKFLGGVAAILILILAIMVIVPDIYDTLSERFVSAAYEENIDFSEGAFGRILDQITSPFLYMDMDSRYIFGHMIGAANNVARNLGYVERFGLFSPSGYGMWAEGGLSQHIVELGILGFFIVIFRFCAAIYLLLLWFSAVFINKNARVALGSSILFYPILVEQITSSLYTSALFWMLAVLYTKLRGSNGIRLTFESPRGLPAESMHASLAHANRNFHYSQAL